MANYYNVTGWRHTGFNYFNRPYSRSVLAQDDFTAEGQYFQMNGIAVNREDMFELGHIDLPGSVKDIIGDQVNAPNSTGTHGPGGPFYSWEEVDYIRLVRTGYPGDDDYIDISGNMSDPWNAPHEGAKLFIAYYFVTGLRPIARNVTRVFLTIDLWLSLGGAEEINIDSGFKIRGHITEAEDASTYNLGAEPISLIDTLEVSQYRRLFQIDTQPPVNFIVCGSDLGQYTPDDAPTINGMVAQVEGGAQVVVPYVEIAPSTEFVMTYPPDTQPIKMDGVGVYNRSELTNVEYNINLLYSAGQLELQDSYSIPYEYVSAVSTIPDGLFQTISGTNITILNPVSMDTGSYPRKANYMFAQAGIMAEATGDINLQPFYQLDNSDVVIWSCPLPGGSPYCRFMNIKGSTHPYDQSIMGMSWVSKSIALSGASGSFWTQVQQAFSQQTLSRQWNKTNFARQQEVNMERANAVKWEGNTALDVIDAVSPAALISTTLEGTNVISNAARLGINKAYEYDTMQMSRESSRKAYAFAVDSMRQELRQMTATAAQALWQSPSVNFVPSLGSGAFAYNTFASFAVNATARDKARARRLFQRYGYSSLYVPLTHESINVKARVNYIEAEGVYVSHPHWPARVCAGITTLLSDGMFFWNERPNMAAFENNPDN